MGLKQKVLVVDDSAFMRKVIADIIGTDSSLEVVGTARDGKDALEKARLLRPDVITMDVEMPVMNGIECIRRIMAEHPVPIVVLSSLTHTGAQATVEALAAGAVDFIQKPAGHASLGLGKIAETIIRKVKVAAAARPRVPSYSLRKKPGAAVRCAAKNGEWHIVIASSTGGPGALLEVFSGLGSVSASITVVQHMPPGFTKTLAARLNTCSELIVVEAEGGEALRPGVAYVAPGGRHMVVEPDRTLKLVDGPPIHGVKPAADVLMDSVARFLAPNVVGVVLTGMGYDGARGMALIKRSGGKTIAEHESTCVVYGMPRAVVEMGNADVVVPVHQVAGAIRKAIGLAG